MIHVTHENPNPNDVTLCGTEDCHGPYVVFSAFELDDVMDPHPVICVHHLEYDIIPQMEQAQADEEIVEADAVDEEDAVALEI